MDTLYNYIIEMSLSRKDVENMMKKYSNQIFQNWVLIRFSSKYSDNEILTINHWKGELKEKMKHLCGKTVSSGNLTNYILNYLNNFTPNINDLRKKLAAEKYINIPEETLKIIIEEFINEYPKIATILSGDYKNMCNYVNNL